MTSLTRAVERPVRRVRWLSGASIAFTAYHFDHQMDEGWHARTPQLSLFTTTPSLSGEGG